MLRTSTCVAAAFMAGLISLACSSSGLKSRGGTAASGGGGQAGGAIGSGTTGGTGGAIGGSTTGGLIGATGGVADGSGGSIGVGGVGSGGTSGGTGGTGSCLPALCSIPMPACAGEVQPNPNDPCGCPICVPNPDGGATKDAGGPDYPAYCELVDCGIERPCSSGYVRSTDPCGCPICAPVDGGSSDAGKPDAPVICNVMCPMIACTYGYLPNPEPCGCPSCALAPDAGRAKDAQDAGTRTPRLHRAAGVACPTGRGPGLSICDCTGSDGPCLCAPGECGQDSNCTAGISGRCLMNGPAPITACSYDTCFSDSDCPAKTPCVCRDSVSSSAPNSCLIDSDCRVDSDCGRGNFCSPSQYGQWCGFTYHCHTASDTCVDDSDCVGAGCNFNKQTGHWACGGDCGPAPP